MQISGIQNYNLNIFKRNTERYKYNSTPILRNDLFQKTAGDVSFTGGFHFTTSSLIQSVKEFKELPRNRIIHCFYCQKPMFSPDFVKDLMKRGIFEGDIADFVQELAPYKSYLRPTSFEIFEYFEQISKIAPQTHLSRALQNINYDAIVSLREMQLPILKKIELEISKLPAEIQQQIQPVFLKHKNRLKGIPQVEEFSSKDFAYKIKKISKSVADNIHRTKLSNYAETMRDTVPLSNQTLYDRNIIHKTFSSNEIHSSHLPVHLKGIHLYLVEQIKKIGVKLGRNDIIITCRLAENMLLGKPVISKFSNKTLRHDLDKVLKGCVSDKQRRKILKLTETLPQSANNINSFIAKHEFSSSSTIGYELLRPSIGTLEHMLPESTRTPYVNTLGNYALACGPCNNERQDTLMSKYLMHFPHTSPQVYFNDMIGVVNDGFISLEDLLRMKETIYKQGSRKMNIQGISNKVLRENFDGPKGQENFDKFIELANQDLISGRDIYELQHMLRWRCGIAVKVDNLKYLFY